MSPICIFTSLSPRCAALTRKVLGGDAQALEDLKQDPDYCRAW
jgi:hypothetical protein